MRREVVVIGSGPAGLMAAATAPEGALVLEARKEPGWKILVSGGGRCNVTNTVSREEYVRLLGPGGRALKHALYSFGPEEIRAWLAEHGCPTVEREEGLVYPKSNRAKDVLDALIGALGATGSEVALSARVSSIRKGTEGFFLDVRGEEIQCQKLCIAYGSPAFDRLRAESDEMIRDLGHSVKPWVPALAPVPLAENPFAGLQGLTFKGRVSVADKWRAPDEVLVTEDGLSGPAVMNAAAVINRRLLDGEGGEFVLDLLPGQNREETLRMLLKLRESHPKAGIEKAFEEVLPRRLAERVIVHAAGKATKAGTTRKTLAEPITASGIKREDAMKIAETVHAFALTAAGIPPFSHAYVASGGVPLDEINPRTMGSKLVPGLFFAGEILDYDAPSGGFNITLALATGRLAGEGLVEMEE